VILFSVAADAQELHVVTEDYAPYNTLRLPATARHFVEVFTEDELLECVNDPFLHQLPFFVLGEGSNTLLTEDFDGLVLKVSIEGKTVVSEDDGCVVWEIGAGLHWHTVVMQAVEEGLHGIESLALIPGTVGAAAVQNIAAYGQNFSDVFVSLDAISLDTGEKKTFTINDARFSYRSSFFKKDTHYCITRVRIVLQKKVMSIPEYVSVGTRRDSIMNELKEHANEPYTPKDISEAVIRIRTRKLLDPKVAPTAGSFFLNPVVTKKKAEELSEIVPRLQWYPEEQLSYATDVRARSGEERVKVAAARMLEHLGWKGKHVGNCFVSPEHALVVTHNGKATGEEMKTFVRAIQKSFLDAYGVSLEVELTVV